MKTKNDADTFETKAYQFITNHRGDVLSIRDSEDNEVGSYTYDAYGNILTAEGALAKENPIRYAGYYYDDETKNYYLQARYYNPANGSFLALDPHPGDDDEPLSQNGYSYANGNPVMNVDPNGEIAKYAVQAIIAMAMPLIKMYGKNVVNKAGNYLLKQVKKIKYFKKWANKYEFQSKGNALIKILKKTKSGKKRVFSIENHQIKAAYMIFKRNKKYKLSGW